MYIDPSSECRSCIGRERNPPSRPDDGDSHFFYYLTWGRHWILSRASSRVTLSCCWDRKERVREEDTLLLEVWEFCCNRNLVDVGCERGRLCISSPQSFPFGTGNHIIHQTKPDSASLPATPCSARHCYHCSDCSACVCWPKEKTKYHSHCERTVPAPRHVAHQTHALCSAPSQQPLSPSSSSTPLPLPPYRPPSSPASEN
jgi:hypothetical protein